MLTKKYICNINICFWLCKINVCESPLDIDCKHWILYLSSAKYTLDSMFAAEPVIVVREETIALPEEI